MTDLLSAHLPITKYVTIQLSVHLLKRGCTLIFSILWYTFWPKFSKTSKIPKNDIYLVKSHQNQFFRAKSGSKGPNLGFGQITIGKSQFFSKVEKSDFFWSDWRENWSKRSAGPIILAKTLKPANFWGFWCFLDVFVVFDPIWKRPNLPVPAPDKTWFFSWIINYTLGTMPGRPEFHGKLVKIFQESLWHFLVIFT